MVAIAGATGSGKSQLFNALAWVAISETGVRRPTTAAPIACSWSDGAATLIDRLGIPGRLRRRPLQSPEAEAQLRGLVLVDLPDHDSAAVQHRSRWTASWRSSTRSSGSSTPRSTRTPCSTSGICGRWRATGGHLRGPETRLDRLPGEAADQVLDDLRRLLDEDGIALGEYGEPGATVMALSALTGDGIGELRLAWPVPGRAGRRRPSDSADLDAAAARLRPVDRPDGVRGSARRRATSSRTGSRTRWAPRRPARRPSARGAATPTARAAPPGCGCGAGSRTARTRRLAALSVRAPADEEATARQRVEQAVRTVADRAARGLPAPWAQAVREAAVRGAQGLSEALDEMATRHDTGGAGRRGPVGGRPPCSHRPR